MSTSSGVTSLAERRQAVTTYVTGHFPTMLKNYNHSWGWQTSTNILFTTLQRSPLPITSNKLPYTWTTKHQQALDTLCKTLTSPPVLKYPKLSDLTTDTDGTYQLNPTLPRRRYREHRNLESSPVSWRFFRSFTSTGQCNQILHTTTCNYLSSLWTTMATDC